MIANTSRGGAADRRRQVCAEGASMPPDCSGARSVLRRRAGRIPSDRVALAHRVEPIRRISVEQIPMALDERHDNLAKVAPASRPLVVGTAPVVVWAVQGAP